LLSTGFGSRKFTRKELQGEVDVKEASVDWVYSIPFTSREKTFSLAY
jgi:hypothetical protein